MLTSTIPGNTNAHSLPLPSQSLSNTPPENQCNRMITFLDLPLPIREQIYRHVLVMARIFVRPFISMDYLFDANRVDTYGIPTLSLLSVCKQIHQEATPIYLRENTFSIVHIDLLAGACRDSPRIAQNLKSIRHIELIFDCRDYIYLAQFVADQLPTVSVAIDALSPSYQKVTVLRALDAMHLDFPSAEGLLQCSPRASSTPFSIEMDMESTASATASALHDRHIENMKEYLWGRTLTFVRKTFRLALLQVDLRHCTCVDGCCRLAEEVLRWGWFHVWVKGMPAQVLVRGASRGEKGVIAKIFDRQRFHAGLRGEEVYDGGRVLDGRDLDGYASVMKGVYERVKGEDGL
ncbi:uncharacterized protein KD926_006328 [Aspergillus affinis]|uniref:uncharacterized protein n=1 Tax=Aspergillus affinis TaxID=1070780 RepID=UPI0022FE26C8|nr:uncharacterized protein KD926_006328 [Aspergillus affinis]KAI9041991.1 hypothetical protein KD926_006328 [Aspergillus affinis]